MSANDQRFHWEYKCHHRFHIFSVFYFIFSASTFSLCMVNMLFFVALVNVLKTAPDEICFCHFLHSLSNVSIDFNGNRTYTGKSKVYIVFIYVFIYSISLCVLHRFKNVISLAPTWRTLLPGIYITMLNIHTKRHFTIYGLVFGTALPTQPPH